MKILQNEHGNGIAAANWHDKRYVQHLTNSTSTDTIIIERIVTGGGRISFGKPVMNGSMSLPKPFYAAKWKSYRNYKGCFMDTLCKFDTERTHAISKRRSTFE